MQEKDVSPLVHPAYGKLFCCLLEVLFIFVNPSKVREKSFLGRKSLCHHINT
jgi:hypothetical protein